MRTPCHGLGVAGVLMISGVLASVCLAADEQVLGRQAQQVLRVHCQQCHGPDSAGRGGMNFILDRDRLVARHKIIPGDAAGSRLYQRVLHGDMPPAGVKRRPGREEMAVLEQWIRAGAPSEVSPAEKRTFLAERDIVRLILADLQTLEPRHRRFARYFTFCHLYNAGWPKAMLRADGNALAKLVNSLSWHPRICRPQAIDPAGTIVRIDLRDLQWNADLWNHVLASYPYRIPQDTAEFMALAAATACELPYLRADWFVANASRPPLYYDLLKLPTIDHDLERQLRVDSALDLEEERVMRAGFNGSGVSRNNRLIERHDAAFGAYWRSYDFSQNTERQNLFDHPRGPRPGQNSFEHAGGEIIFHLPNGLQGYLLVDGLGRRIERAPVEIVSDPRRPDRQVEAGLSCISCHVRGLIIKADQVRAHVDKNRQAFSNDDVAAVHALYPPEARFKVLFEEDCERFQNALARTGVMLDEVEPIAGLTQRYEGEIDLAAAAAETGLAPAEFLQQLQRSSSLSRVLGPLNTQGGTVQRQVFLASFAELVRELHPGQVASVTDQGPSPLALPAPFQPFAGHTGPVLCLAFSPDGQYALSGSQDRTVRLWEVASGRLLRSLSGHTDEVLAVAFSADGKRALSGGSDRTLRLWDLASGRAQRCLAGHTDRVTSVAFSPDGRRALSGSWDRALILWDLESGREVQRLGGHSGSVSSVAFAPDGRHALSGSYDGTMRLWELEQGRERRRFLGHSREIYSVAFAPDGRRALSGGNDQDVCLWDVDSGRELRHFHGHSRAVIQVAFSGDGRRILSANSQYQGSEPAIRLWEADTGRELRRLGGPGDTVWSIAFSADGSRALSSRSDRTLRSWDLTR